MSTFLLQRRDYGNFALPELLFSNIKNPASSGMGLFCDA
jgi:hypothetical protein